MTYCDGCGEPVEVSEWLWLAAPLGRCCVKVHRSRECAEKARLARGGGKFIPEPVGKDERAEAALQRARQVSSSDG